MNSGSRLLEINNLNEFYFIQKSAKNLLKIDQMIIEINNSKGILSSSIAFTGSQGIRSSTNSKLIIDRYAIYHSTISFHRVDLSIWK